MQELKEDTSSYQENKKFLSRRFMTKEDFAEEYKRLYYEKAKVKALYLLMLTELKETVTKDDVVNLKNLSILFRYINYVEDASLLWDIYCNPENPIRSTNLVILACKYDKIGILKCLLDNSDIIANVSVCSRRTICPEDEDELCNNAFYYAIRSGNVKLFEALVDMWCMHIKELDRGLSLAYEELKLRNVPLTDEMAILVESKLIEARFFSDTSEKKSAKNDLENVRERVKIVLDNINTLMKMESNTKEVEQKFLFTAKYIAQNIHMLKRQLKPTYDRLPWEEMEFCLVSFVSSYTTQQQINSFYRAVLNKHKILTHLRNFAEKLKNESLTRKSMDTSGFYELLKLGRERIVADIIRNYPQFEELYTDYRQIRDITSLDKMEEIIYPTLSAVPSEQQGQLIILRAIQVIGEHLKNTLESPKLSASTAEYLLLMLSKNTKKIINNLRDSLSHVHSLFEETQGEQTEVNVFANIQNDIRKVGSTIQDILHDKKFQVIRELLEKISNTRDPYEIKEIADIIFNIRMGDMAVGYGITTKEHDELKELINTLRNKITDKTHSDEMLFNKIDNIINPKIGYTFSVLPDYALEVVEFLFGNKRIDSNGVYGIQPIVETVLANIPKRESKQFKEVAKLVLHIGNSVKSRTQDITIGQIIQKIFCIAEFDARDIKWIQELKGKLDINKMKNKNTEQGKQNREKLSKTISLLKEVLATHKFNDQLAKEVFIYKKNKSLNMAVEMLVLNIMSMLDLGVDTRLENNNFFLDDNTPVLTGKCLRNHLAHYNSLIELLPSDPSVAVILNAQKFTEKDIIRTTNKIGKFITDDPLKSREKYTRGLFTIDRQERMFTALQEGNLESLKECLKEGVDISGRSRQLWTALHFAAKGPSVKVVKFVLDQNINPNVKDINGQSALHIAAAYGRDNTVKFLIEKAGLHINMLDSSDNTPLHIAAQNGHKNVVKLLLENDADTTGRNVNRFTPLHCSIQNGHTDVVKVLLSKETHVDDNKTENDLTPLHIAARNGHLRLIEFLLMKKANVNAMTSNNGWTPLHFAAVSGDENIARCLIKGGAYINPKSLSGDTPLHLAAQSGNVDVVVVLLKHGANINVKSTGTGDSPLHLATERGHERVVMTLLRKGADVNAKGRNKLTPLHTATLMHVGNNKNGNKKVVKILLEQGANVNLQSSEGDTPLHFALRSNNEEVIAVLLNNGADVNIPNKNGSSPSELAAFMGNLQVIRALLESGEVNVDTSVNDCTMLHAAAMYNYVEVAEYLIEKGADVNATNDENATPLHYVAEGGSSEIATALIANGADIHFKNVRGQQPIHLAAGCGHRDIVEILIKNGANVDAEDDQKTTPIHCATQHGNIDIIKVLLDKGANVNATTKAGITPLHQTVVFGAKDVCEFLVKRGADLNATDSDKSTPLHLAASERRSNVVEVLLNSGAMGNVRNAKDTSPIELAVLNDDIHIVKLLLRKVYINTKDNNGNTVLHVAANSGKLGIAKYLIEEGADVNVQNIDGYTPLHTAVTNKHEGIAEVLKAKGADVTIKDKYGRTAEELDLVIAYRNIYGAESPEAPFSPYDSKTKQLLEQILSSQEKYHGFHHPKVQETLTSLGSVYMNLGENEKAKISFQRALNIQESHDNSESPKIADCLVQLSNAYGKSGNPEKHRELLECALKIKEKHYGPDSCEVAEILNNLAVVYGHLGDFHKKKELLERALVLEEKHHTLNHINAVNALLNLSNAYHTLGDLQKQKETLEKALQIQKRLPHNVSLGHALHNLSNVYLYSDDVQRAKELLEEALTVKENHYGANHFELTSTLTNLSTVYDRLGDHRKEKELLERAIKIQETYYGPNSYKVSFLLSNLGLTYGKLGNFRKQRELCEEAVSRAEKHYGSDHYEMANLLANLGVACGSLGDDHHKSTELLKRALRIKEKHYGPNHFDLARTLTNLSYCYKKVHDYQKEKELLQRALQIQEKHFDAGHSQSVEIRMKLSICYGNLGDVQKKMQLIEQALENRKKSCGSDDYQVSKILQTLGDTYIESKDAPKAIALYKEALKIQEKHYGPDHIEITSLLTNLGALYGQSHIYYKAKEFYERALPIQQRFYSPRDPEIGKTVMSLAHTYAALEDTKALVELLGSTEGLMNRDNTPLSNNNNNESLHRAAESGDLKTVCDLLEKGANVNAKDDDGRTPLHYAVDKGHIDIICALLISEADATTTTNKGNTPLHIAALKGRSQVVDILLRHLSDNKLPNVINVKTISGKTTALHVAAKNGSLDIVKSLLRHGAAYDVQNKDGKTPLDLCEDRNVITFLKSIQEVFRDVMTGHVGAVSRLKAMQRDEIRAAMYARDNQDRTLLQVAIVNKRETISSELVGILKTIQTSKGNE